MKYKLFVMSTLVMMILTGCSNKNDLYKNGTEELANGNYEKAIELFIEYKNTYSDSKPLKESYCQYADFLYNNNKYIDSLCLYKLASKLDATDNTIFENIENVSNAIYNKAIEFLDNGEELLTNLSIEDYQIIIAKVTCDTGVVFEQAQFQAIKIQGIYYLYADYFQGELIQCFIE